MFFGELKELEQQFQQGSVPNKDELSGEYEGRVSFVKVNVDENPKASSRYGIRSIPTLLLFQDGKPMSQMVGFRPKAELKRHLDEALSKTGE